MVGMQINNFSKPEHSINRFNSFFQIQVIVFDRLCFRKHIYSNTHEGIFFFFLISDYLELVLRVMFTLTFYMLGRIKGKTCPELFSNMYNC